jgi:2-polyprenyl-6-methoxyphenol hydroxylase-like FAD-dependent oxidoreductase
MDVVWFRLPRRPADRIRSGGTFSAGRIFITIDRGDYWQCAYVIPKGGFEALQAEGIAAFRNKLAALLPFDPARSEEIRGWDQVSLLTVAVDRLAKWHRPGLLCIGDAAHAMSPIGGVGVNLAIQDAVAAANRLAGPLAAGILDDADLAAVQARRNFPTRATQKLQLMMRSSRRADEDDTDKRKGPPAFIRGIIRFPLLAHLAGRLIGLGFRMEHVRKR